MHIHPITVTFTTYFIIVFGIGFYASRRIHSLDDFVLGGRNLHGAIAALGVGASDMSGWLLLGLPGAVYVHGINQIWMPLGLSIGALVNWHWVAVRLRIYTEMAGDALTIPAFLDNRFDDQVGLLRIIAAIVVVLFYTVYAAAGFVGGALLFETIFQLSYYQALSIGAVVIILYTCIGGFLAVNWIDFFQGSLMFIALISVPLVAMHHIGSWSDVLANVHTVHPHMNDAFTGVSVISVISLLTWGLGYMGQPHILVRFMAISKPSELPKARFICMAWMIISLYGAIFTGFIGIAYFSDKPLVDPESVFIQFSLLLFNPWVAGCLLAAVLSAVMSTIAAQLLASSSSLVEDVYRRFCHPKAGARELIWVSRLLVVVVAGVALLFSVDRNSQVLTLVSYGWAGLGATFGPVILFSLFWRRTNRCGAACGMVIGAITVILWKLCASWGGLFELYSILPGFITGALGVVIGSYLGKPATQKMLACHDDFVEQVSQTFYLSPTHD